jgi:hypothetical protein
MIPRAQPIALMTRSLTLALLLGSAATQRAEAQRQRSQALIVAVVDSLADQHAVAMLYRYPDDRKDMIVLRRSDATPIALGAALNLLDTLRQRVPAPSPGRLEIVNLQSTPPASAVNRHRADRATAILAGLAKQPVTAVGKIGRGQQIGIAGTHASP